MEVKLDITRAVFARQADDGVVVPTNSSMNVFATHAVDDLDGSAKGNYSMDEFHGYALSVTNHLSHDNLGQKRAPIKLDPTDKSTLKLPDSYMIQPSVELNQNDIFCTQMCHWQSETTGQYTYAQCWSKMKHRCHMSAPF